MKSQRPIPALTTYQKARLQVVGYRTLQSSVNQVLSAHELNTSQWIILGWLHDNPTGMRVTALADVLDVETPLVTTLLQPLQARSLISAEIDRRDKRAKVLRLTDSGEQLVADLEIKLKDGLAYYEAGFESNEIDAYFLSLQRFIENSGLEGK